MKELSVVVLKGGTWEEGCVLSCECRCLCCWSSLSSTALLLVGDRHRCLGWVHIPAERGKQQQRISRVAGCIQSFVLVVSSVSLLLLWDSVVSEEYGE